MDGLLVLGALAIGLAGTPHCLAMCGAACTAVAGGCDRGRPQRALIGLHLGRLVGYALAGAVAAGSVGALAALASAVPVLRPLWTLVHLLALGLGLHLLWRARQPAWLEALGRGVARGRASATAPAGGGRWQPMIGPTRATAAGLLWVAWPCGLLQSALLMAALANGAAGGAAVMGAFAIASSLGLLAGPALWWRLTRGAGIAPQWGVRIAGAGLVAASAFALGHGLWATLWALCVGA